MSHNLSIGDVIIVTHGRFRSWVGVVTAVDWDNPRNPYPVTAELDDLTKRSGTVIKTFAFGQVRKRS